MSQPLPNPTPEPAPTTDADPVGQATETRPDDHPPASNRAPSRPSGSVAAAIHTLNRPNIVAVGTVVWLASELMFFAGLFGIYFTARAITEGPWPIPPAELNLPYALLFTTILIASSFTCQLGVFAAERGDVFALRRWYAISMLLGAIFVGGQINEYRQLITQGVTLSSSAFGSVFYLTTGFHGLHVIGGLIAFGLIMARTKLSKFTPAQATGAIVVSYYWHFVDVVWIALFATIYIVQ